MARAINRLSARGILALKGVGRYSDGAGLYLLIDSGGSKRGVFVLQWLGKRREMGF